jgi:AraC-like DNA-binding protein
MPARGKAARGGSAARRRPGPASGDREADLAVARLAREIESWGEVMSGIPKLARVRKFAEERLSQRLSLKRVARIARFEYTYFSTWFHVSVGTNYSTWLSSLRVLEATRHLRHRRKPLDAIAKEVGFGHLRTMERAFKKRLGMTPKQFRSMVHGERD